MGAGVSPPTVTDQINAAPPRTALWDLPSETQAQEARGSVEWPGSRVMKEVVHESNQQLLPWAGLWS